MIKKECIEMAEFQIYEELNRVLSGRIDFNEMIDRVNRSYIQKTRNDILNVWNGISEADLGTTYYPTRGTYDEDKLMDLIARSFGAIKVRPDQKILIERNLEDYATRVETIKNFVTRLVSLLPNKQ